jgi:trans-2,3-dihydro-3-hydroxyanthranilate isomerase
MRKLNYSVVDVFTTRPLEGNPLAVFTNPGDLSAETMQRLAQELNLSETAFILPPRAGGTARLRIFTPRRELPFAGHPIVGSAYVIARAAPLGLLRFETGVGEVPVVVDREGGFVSRCTMTQPEPRFAETDVTPEVLSKALGANVIGAVLEATNGPSFLLAMVDDVDAIARDAGALARLPHAVGVYERPRDGVTRQRLFAPGEGIAEDPATGSLAGLVGARLAREGLVDGALEIHQGAQVRRPSVIYVDARAGERPRVGGACASVARGTFELPRGV